MIWPIESYGGIRRGDTIEFDDVYNGERRGVVEDMYFDGGTMRVFVRGDARAFGTSLRYVRRVAP